MKFLPALALSSVAVTVTAAVGSLVTTPGDLWYKALKKPSFQPPLLRSLSPGQRFMPASLVLLPRC